MFNIWQKLSALPIISSISFQLSSSWGEQMTNCSTLGKKSKINKGRSFTALITVDKIIIALEVNTSDKIKNSTNYN